MKVKKSLILVVMTLVIFFSTTIQGAYAEPGIMPLWDHMSSITNGLTINNDNANMRIYVRAYGNIKRIEVTTKLQQYKDSDWHTIETYELSNNRYFLLWEDNYSPVDKGYTYRLFSEIRAYELSENGKYILMEKLEMITEYEYK